MSLSFYFILKFGNHDFFTSVCFIHIKRMGNVKAGIACDELIKHFPIRPPLMNLRITRIFITHQTRK